MDGKHPEPAIVDVGFTQNRRGGWWYRELQNRYTIQIVPANLFNPESDERGWRIGLARPGGEGMRWGSMLFPAPEAAALHACRVIHDDGLRDAIVQAMSDNHEKRTKGIKRAIDNFMRVKGGKS